MIKKTFIGFTLLVSGFALAVTANAATTCLLPSTSSGSQIVTCATQTGVSNATNTLSLKTKDGLIRTYTVHLPPNYDKNKAYKLVVALHGGFGSGASMETQTNLSKVADMRTGEKFIIVYPDGYKDVARAWNAGGCCGTPALRNIDDVSFIKELVASLKTKYSISKVYATGMSNGGMLANRLACEASDVFTSIAPVSGTIQVPTCVPTKPIGVLMVHGTDDTRVPYNGGFGTGKPTAGVTFVSVPKTLSDWAIRNKCSTNFSTSVVPPLTNDGITIDKLTYAKCAVPTMLYRVNGGSHSWPGGTAASINILEDKSPTQSLNTSKIILDFFAEASSAITDPGPITGSIPLIPNVTLMTGSVMDAIKADMTLNEAPLLGVSGTAGWHTRSIMSMGGTPRGDNTPYYWNPTNLLYKNSDYWNSIAPWFVIYKGVDNKATNVRVKISEISLYVLKKSTNKWELIGLDSANPTWASYYSNGLGAGNASGSAKPRVESDGKLSYKLGTFTAIHGGAGKFEINGSDVKAVFAQMKTELVLDDPLGIDDRSKAQLLATVGTDYYPSMTTKVADFTPAGYVPNAAASRFGLISSVPRTHYLATINPPGQEKNVSVYQKAGGVSSISVAEFESNLPPNLISSTVGLNSNFTLGWSSTSSTVTNYQIKIDNRTQISKGTALSMTTTPSALGFLSGSTHTFSVRACNARLCSAWSTDKVLTVSKTTTPPPTTNTPPTISGTPATSVTLGNAYTFTPNAIDINGDLLTFTIINKPSWATFSTNTGKLSGTPTAVGTSTNIKISVTDGKSISVSLPVFSLAVTRSAAPPTPPAVTKKYTPGHYVTIGGGDVKKLDDSQTDLTDGLAFATELKNSGVKGVVVRYLWKDLEPTMDGYNFTRIKQHLDLLQSVGLKMVIFIDDKAFSGPTPLPSYLMANSDYYFINTLGAHSATRWNPYVLTRFNSLFTKMGAQFDSHPALEGVTYQETSSQLSANTVTVPPYDPVLYKETIIKTLTNQATAFPKSNVFWMMNFIGSGYHDGVFMKNPESQALIRDIANATMPLGVIMGGPDILPEETSLTTRTYPFYKEFSAKGMKLFGSAQNDSFRELHSTSTGSVIYPTRFWTPLEIFQYGRDELHINYLFWNYKTWLSKTTDAKYQGPGEYVWADAIPVIKANAVFNPVTPKKFNLNQNIKTTANVNVRSTSTTAILGTQALGAIGTIVTDPLNVVSTTIPNPKWWKVDFGTGIDGWVNEDYIVSGLGITPPPASVASSIPTPSPASTTAKLLFKSNFGKGVTLSPLYSFYTSGKGAWQDLKGTDSETGYSFPVTGIPNQNFSGIQWITYATVTPDTIGENISTEIREVTGPAGKPVNELFTSVKKKGPLGVGSAQAQFMVRRDHKYGDVKDMYITYWAKHPADLITKLDPSVSSANWHAQFEFKTGGYENTGNGDYRIQTTILKNKDGKLYWMSKGDNGANGPFPFVDYWIERNYDVPVILDKWFKYEVYWHRSAGADGRYWTAVDGQVLFDHKGPNMGDYNLPINRIFFAPAYSGGNTPVESHITGLEIWDGFPCGVGVSCYKKP